MVGAKSFPPVLGGIETHVYEIALRLARRGARVSVIVPRTPSRTRTENVNGVRVRPVFNIGTRYTLKLSMMPSIAAEIKRSRGLVHAHDATGGFVAAEATGDTGFVYTMHGVGFHPGDWPTPFRQGIQLLERTALRNARHVFCTDVLSARYASSQREQVEVLPNAVDVSLFGTREERPTQYVQGKFVFLFVGRLVKVKGVETLLDSISRIPESLRSNAQFVFVGDGPLRGEVVAAGRRIPQIRVVGTIPHDSILPYFAHADAFLLPSLSEGLPISLLEALAASLPCVASDVGGISSQIPGEVLRLVPPGDAEQLAKQMIELLSNPEGGKALGLAGKSYVEANFSWDRTVDRLVEVYRGVIASRRP